MSSPRIYNSQTLKQELLFLKTERTRQEALISAQVQELYETVKDPVPYVKRTVSELAGDKDLRSDLIKIAINIASNYISAKYSGLGSGAENISSLISKLFKGKATEKSPGILDAIVSLFARRKK